MRSQNPPVAAHLQPHSYCCKYSIRFSSGGRRIFHPIGGSWDGWTRERAEAERGYVMAQVTRGEYLRPRREPTDRIDEALIEDFVTEKLLERRGIDDAREAGHPLYGTYERDGKTYRAAPARALERLDQQGCPGSAVCPEGGGPQAPHRSQPRRRPRPARTRRRPEPLLPRGGPARHAAGGSGPARTGVAEAHKGAGGGDPSLARARARPRARIRRKRQPDRQDPTRRALARRCRPSSQRRSKARRCAPLGVLLLAAIFLVVNIIPSTVPAAIALVPEHAKPGR